MITNRIAYWRSTMNQGIGVTQAHLARKVGVGRSFVTKLEKGVAQPGAELMFRVAGYFRQPVEAVFQVYDGAEAKPVIICSSTIPSSQFYGFAPVPAKPLRNSPATPPARPAGSVSIMGESPVGLAAKAVASPVALVSQKKK